MESLQFQKAEYADPRRKCVLCSNIIDRSYFQLSGQTVCPACAQRVGGSLGRPSQAVLLRGALFGTGAAIGCSICYAIITAMTGLELAIASIAVGYLIGRAVRMGTNGVGGRALQIIAVVLTYLSITASYLPVMMKSAEAAADAHLSVNWTFLVGVALVSPFLELTQGVGGILGLAIIVFGLMQAWKQTAGSPHVLAGPYTLEGNPS